MDDNIGELDRTVCTGIVLSIDETGTVSETEEGEPVELTEEGETINTIDGNCFSGAGAAYIFERMGPANWQQVAMYENPTPFTNDHFGASCDITANYVTNEGTAIVGIPDDNICINGNVRLDGGTACIFEEGGDWSTATCQKIGASDCNTGDEFGFSVGIDMTTAIVGAPLDQTDCGFFEFDCGAAYFFNDNNPWTQIQKVAGNDTNEDDEFGKCVALDGGAAVMGAPEKGDGDAYIFELSGTWGQVQKIGAGSSSDEQFGRSCDIYIGGCGNTVIVGDDEFGTGDPGRAFTFERNGSWPSTPTDLLIPFDSESEQDFGRSVAIYCDSALVGSPYDNVPCEQQPDNPYCVCALGENVCDTSDLNSVEQFFGNRDQGSAYRFLRDENNNMAELILGPWFFEEKLLASDGYDYDRFGKDVSNTEQYCLVGAPHADVVENGDAPGPCPDSAGDSEENSIETIDDSNSVNNGCGPKDQGKAYIYEKGDEPVIITGFGGPGGRFAALENRKNRIFITGMPPNSKMSFIFGFKKGMGVVQNGTCSGTEVNIKPFKPLGTLKANGNGDINGKKLTVPNVGKAQFMFLQGVVINSGDPCLTTPRIRVIIIND
jgi:FG-GAP repeat protein